MQSVLRLGVSMRCTGPVDRIEPQAIDHDKPAKEAVHVADGGRIFPRG